MPSNSTIDKITSEDRLKYINIFQSLNPVNNILHGEQARAIFVRSGLPPAILQKIWNLADTRKSGSLNQTEFIIAMHYIESAMKGMTSLPSTLPANVYASATGRSVAPSPLMRNNTLQVQSPPPVPLRSPVFKGTTIKPTDITSEEYAKYNTFFHQLDSDNLGYVSGPDAVVFFKHSKLSEADLARIWDLADTNSSGQLNEQEFAIAMHLINRRVAGGEIPNALPTFNSISSASQIPQQFQPHQSQQPQPQRNVDLLGLNTDFTSTPALSTLQQPELNQSELSRTQSTLQTNTNSQSTRAQTLQSQLHVESQAVQDLQKQVEQQKEALAKIKQEADEAERKLEAEKRRKEELTKELQMYKQEIKHYTTRIESAQDETAKLRKENEELEKEKQAKSTANNQALSVSPFDPTSITTTTTIASTSPQPAHDFFTLTTPHLTSSSSELFAKVTEPHNTTSPSHAINTIASPVISHHTGSTVNSQQQPKFDPFAGFKASQQKQSSSSALSPTASLNKLKEESEHHKRSVSPNVDISEIESKFPDLSTMESNFTASPTLSSVPPTTSSSTQMDTPTSPKNKTDDLLTSLFKRPSTTTDTKKVFSSSQSTPSLNNDSKFNKNGFDLSAFEPPSSSSFETTTTIKDELSSLFGSPSTTHLHLPDANKQQQQNSSSTFDDIFGNVSRK
ncbi:MAG: hypothetical protein EXX96DRAFT_597643 [Benjaminiella poitrasii]|nr:MAG: hypothetical protein EXX96DRAFT_597643 [Benjaminiella poitrasii]